MTDIYVKPVIIDIETGDIIDNDSLKTESHMRLGLCLLAIFANQTYPLMRTIKKRSQHVC